MLTKVVSVIGDNCPGMHAPLGGVIAELQSLLGLDVPFVIDIGCWLHVLSLALCHVIEETFGKASENVCVSEIKNVTLLNLLFSTWVAW